MNEWSPKLLAIHQCLFKVACYRGSLWKTIMLWTRELQRHQQASWCDHSGPRNSRMEAAGKPPRWLGAWNEVIRYEQSLCETQETKGRATTPRGVLSPPVAAPEASLPTRSVRAGLPGRLAACQPETQKERERIPANANVWETSGNARP